MEPRVSELLRDAQKLSHEDMATLVHELLRAFDPPDDIDLDAGIDRVWEEEALRRLHEIEDGSVQSVDGRETPALIRRRLAARHS